MRLLGAVLILGAAVWLGAALALKESCRLKDLSELERALLLLSGEIEYLSAPLPEVLTEAGRRASGVVGECFLSAAERMERREGLSAGSIWQEIWWGNKEQTFFTKEDLEAILSFGTALDCMDKKQQEANILFLQSYLKEAAKRGRKRLDKNGRLYLGTGVLGGLLLVTALI